MRVVLASASPRRAEILRQLRIPFEVDPANVDETWRPEEQPVGYAARMAREKATAVGTRRTADVVLGSDTVVAVDGEALIKPIDERDAEAMLGRLSGRSHDVITAVAIACGGQVTQERTVSTRVVFRRLTTDLIRRYVALGEGRDKAGSYAIQGVGAGFVDRIEGSYHAVVGLPVCETLALLDASGALSEWP